MSGFGSYYFGQGSFGSGQTQKPKVFVSYHHQNDQNWYKSFSDYFGNVYNLITDNSLDRQIDSNNADYIREKIREDNITGTSLTIVLCGKDSYKRRWIDWEIQMTLNKHHALLGIVLPTNLLNAQNNYTVPDRFLDNVNTGYAHWIYWTTDPNNLATAINLAKEKVKFTSKIDNSRQSMKRSLS
jgi:hypothetical protein